MGENGRHAETQEEREPAAPQGVESNHIVGSPAAMGHPDSLNNPGAEEVVCGLYRVCKVMRYGRPGTSGSVPVAGVPAI
jgi:hypothetical protein